MSEKSYDEMIASMRDLKTKADNNRLKREEARQQIRQNAIDASNPGYQGEVTDAGQIEQQIDQQVQGIIDENQQDELRQAVQEEVRAEQQENNN